MKKIIDIIKETAGNETIVARYTIDKEHNLDTGIMDSELPEVGETLTDGNQEMTVVEHVVIDGRVGVKFDNYPALVDGGQLVKMLADVVVRVK